MLQKNRQTFLSSKNLLRDITQYENNKNIAQGTLNPEHLGSHRIGSGGSSKQSQYNSETKKYGGSTVNNAYL